MSYIFISYDSETDTKTSGLKGLKSANFTLVKCPLIIDNSFILFVCISI